MTRLDPEQPLLLLAGVSVNDFDVFLLLNMTFAGKKDS